MVRKSVLITLACCLLIATATITASAQTVYEGTISSTFTTIAEQINLPVMADYVFFRSGQYTYTLVVGDLEYNSGNFSLSDAGKVYTITQVNNSGYGSTSYYSYSVSDVSSYKVEADDKLVYSNLGGYPTLNNNSDVYSFSILIVLSIIALCSLIRPTFNFLMRDRGERI